MRCSQCFLARPSSCPGRLDETYHIVLSFEAPRAEETRRGKKRSRPGPSVESSRVEPALARGAIPQSGFATPEDAAKQRIMRMAARVNATKVPALAATAASTAVGDSSVGAAGAAAHIPAPAASLEAAAGPSAAIAQGSNSLLRQLHQVRHANVVCGGRDRIPAVVGSSVDTDCRQSLPTACRSV